MIPSRHSAAVLLGVAILWTGMASAQSIDRRYAVSESLLESIRGGFDVGGGLLGSFGIERATYINGQLLAHSEVTIADVSRITPQEAAALATVLQMKAIRNGPDNFSDPASFTSTSAATVIQNSLDNQNIQNLTSIHATVNTLPVLDALHLQETLQTGLVQSIGH